MLCTRFPRKNTLGVSPMYTCQCCKVFAGVSEVPAPCPAREDKMKVFAIGFLQNLWVKDPARIAQLLSRQPGLEYRARVLRQLLFAGSLTGRRLKKTFGEQLEYIQFEECTLEIAGDSRTICAPNPQHIATVLNYYEPTVVIVFGKVAQDTIACVWNGVLIKSPHPASRQPDIMLKLQGVSIQLSANYKAAQQLALVSPPLL